MQKHFGHTGLLPPGLFLALFYQTNMFFLYLGGRNDMMVYNEDRSVQVLIPSQESGKISTIFCHVGCSAVIDYS